MIQITVWSASQGMIIRTKHVGIRTSVGPPSSPKELILSHFQELLPALQESAVQLHKMLLGLSSTPG